MMGRKFSLHRARPGALQKFVALAVGSVLAFSVHAQPSGLPSMGSASSAELSPALERTLGDAIMEQGRRDPTYINDPDVSQYLAGLGKHLVAASSNPAQHIEVFAIRDPQINAFALPGGYVGIHSGLVVASDNESQLASVVAHEIGHVLQRHVARGMTQQAQSSHLMMASIAGALLAALAGSGDLAMGVAAFGQAAAVDRQLGFSRQAEQEADRIGLDMLRRGGFDPNGMAQMFGQLMNASRLNEGTGGGLYASTHPLSIQRMSDIQNRIREAPSRPRQDSDTYWYVRAKLRVLQERGGQRSAEAALRREAENFQGVRRSAAWYGLAYSAWRQGDLAATKTALDAAREGGVNSPEIAGLGIALAVKQNRLDDALAQAEAAWKRWPQSLGIALARVEALKAKKQDSQIVPFLQARIKQWPDEPRLYQQLAQSFERLGQGVEARRNMAIYYEKVGALPTAVEQLQQARNMSSDFYVQSQIDVEIRRLQEKVRADRALLERFRQ
ncbi:MAG TPA: M48 family metalloprotease [Pusillimonas sp.]|uniref:M48 family metalloprotease n=2 Tax=unclassified Pusillimonas TaxID=2640016 RepID=UPI0026263240|nr:MULTISPECIES: M48 family metalloprotease [unclassified Pusillimonas]HLU20238.1 M48 family metalloprotease [Pusillimonas sp.]